MAAGRRRLRDASLLLGRTLAAVGRPTQRETSSVTTVVSRAPKMLIVMLRRREHFPLLLLLPLLLFGSSIAVNLFATGMFAAVLDNNQSINQSLFISGNQSP